MRVSKSTIKKKKGRRACLGDIVGQTYPIYAWHKSRASIHWFTVQLAAAGSF